MELKAGTGEFAFLRAVQSSTIWPSHGRPRRPLDGAQTPSPGPKVAETHLVGDREHKQGNVYEMAGSARFDVVSGIPMVPMVPMVTAEAFRQIPPPSKL